MSVIRVKKETTGDIKTGEEPVPFLVALNLSGTSMVVYDEIC